MKTKLLENQDFYLLLFSRKRDMDIFGIVPPPVTFDFPIFSLRNVVDDNMELVEVDVRLCPKESFWLIRLKLMNNAKC